jgi:hypothetical protein
VNKQALGFKELSRSRRNSSRSIDERVRAVAALETLALNCGVSETLSEVILRAVTTAVATVAHHWDDHLAVDLVVAEDFFESARQLIEVFLFADTALKHAGLDGSSLGSTVQVHAEVALLPRLGHDLGLD